MSDDISNISGVGAKRAESLALLGITTVGDLLRHLPRRYEDRGNVVLVSDIDLAAPEPVSVVGTLSSFDLRRTRTRGICAASCELSDASGSVKFTLFGPSRRFAPFHVGVGVAAYGVPEAGTRSERSLSSCECVVFDRSKGAPDGWLGVVPIYPASASLSSQFLHRIIGRALDAELEIHDYLPSDLLASRNIAPLGDLLRGVHRPRSIEHAEQSRRGLAYRELLARQLRIASSVRERRAMRGARIAPSAMLGHFMASLPFDLTSSQKTAIEEICADMREGSPMRRLLHGDVGSGKTVVACAAASACVGAGKQCAILVPTTVLSAQFIASCERMLAPIGLRCAELRGGAPAAERRALLASVESGEVDVLVGTHAILEDDVHFKSLALVIIDEQHRFGVRQRETLLSGSNVSPHLLLMSATPIPRTMCMALYGDMDVTALREKPPTRKPVVTKLVSSNHAAELCRYLAERAAKGERCYWVCPMIEEGARDEAASVFERAEAIGRAAPSLKVARLHGAMSDADKRAAIDAFARGEVDVLVSTTVIEVGVDVPDASTIVIEGATGFGLSQLHQMRGRVGRGERPGLCVLLDGAKKLAGNRRMEIMLETDDGFRVAELDLQLRGAGDTSGVRQHGFSSFVAAELPKDSDLLEMATRDAASLAADDLSSCR